MIEFRKGCRCTPVLPQERDASLTWCVLDVYTQKWPLGIIFVNLPYSRGCSPLCFKHKSNSRCLPHPARKQNRQKSNTPCWDRAPGLIPFTGTNLQVTAEMLGTSIDTIAHATPGASRFGVDARQFIGFPLRERRAKALCRGKPPELNEKQGLLLSKAPNTYLCVPVSYCETRVFHGKYLL